jgi:hypothetical protein
LADQSSKGSIEGVHEQLAAVVHDSYGLDDVLIGEGEHEGNFEEDRGKVV